jgi:pSer/pThr/pTyr-binding forkhead associated (FHA) protein
MPPWQRKTPRRGGKRFGALSMDAKLVVVGGEAKAAEIRLKLPTVIGRGREASLMVPHPLVSRRHCEIYEQAGQLVVRDLGSLNGTYVNNLKVVGEAILPPGQLLTIGAVTFRALYETGAPGEGEGEASGPTSDLSATVYAGDGRPPVDKSRPGATKRVTKDAPPADVTIRQKDFDPPSPPSPLSEGETPVAEDAVSTDDSDDALQDFLRNLN